MVGARDLIKRLALQPHPEGGDTLKLMQSASSDTVPEPILLGPAELADCHLQAVVPAGHWQAAKPVPDGRHGYVLIGCVVSPGFDFSGFELAPEGWQPGRKD